MDKDVPDRPIDLDTLTKPFPREALKTRSDRGKTFTYVQGHTVINRLNAATENRWTFEILHTESRDVAVAAKENRPARTDLLITAHVRLTIPGLGAREHVGVQMVSPGSGEDLVKGAVTDALKKASSLFGVGIELFGPDYEDGELDEARPAAPAPARVTSHPGAEQAASGESPRDGAARTLWNEAKALGFDKKSLDLFCIDRTNHTLDKADTQALIKCRSELKFVEDIPALIDFLTNRPERHADPEPARANPETPDDQPCAIEGCTGSCKGDFINFSLRRYGVPLCIKHSALAKRGELDSELERLNNVAAR